MLSIMNTVYPEPILHQFICESDEWARLLNFLKQENVFYKSRLAEVVNNVDDENIVAEAEKFNEDFLSQDRIIDFLTDELESHNKLLQQEWYLDDDLLKDVIRHQKKLRVDVEKAEELFSGTKKNFSGFLNSLL
jgi:hypothetical protein